MKKKLALLLSAVMVIGSIRMSAFAETNDVVSNLVSETDEVVSNLVNEIDMKVSNLDAGTTNELNFPITGTVGSILGYDDAPYLEIYGADLEDKSVAEFDVTITNAQWYGFDAEDVWAYDTYYDRVKQENISVTVISDTVAHVEITNAKITSIEVYLETKLTSEGEAMVIISNASAPITEGEYNFATVEAGTTNALNFPVTGTVGTILGYEDAPYLEISGADLEDKSVAEFDVTITNAQWYDFDAEDVWAYDTDYNRVEQEDISVTITSDTLARVKIKNAKITSIEVFLETKLTSEGEAMVIISNASAPITEGEYNFATVEAGTTNSLNFPVTGTVGTILGYEDAPYLEIAGADLEDKSVAEFDVTITNAQWYDFDAEDVWAYDTAYNRVEQEDISVTITNETLAHVKITNAEITSIEVFLETKLTSEGEAMVIISDASAPITEGEYNFATVKTDKKDVSAPNAPTMKSVTSSSITLNVINGAEYSIDGAKWQNSATFTGLTADTSYTFYARIAETETTNPSPSSIKSDAIKTSKSSSGGGSSSSGGGSSSAILVTVVNTNNGSVSVNNKRPSKGDKVKITVKPDEGYEMKSLSVKENNGDKLDYVDNENGTYTFVYDGSKVTIKAEFSEEIVAGTEDTTPLTHDNETPFNDIYKTQWFYESVKYVFENKIMAGTENNKFSPNLNLSRAMLATIIWRIAGEPISNGNSFSDVEDGTWYTTGISWAQENGIVAGYTDGIFAPNESLTREQMVVMLYNYSVSKGNSVGAKADLGKYNDSSEVSDWSKEAFEWAVAEGIISGRTDSELAPKGTVTRAEASMMIYKFLNK